MKSSLKVVFITWLISISLTHLSTFASESKEAKSSQAGSDAAHDEWLRSRFQEQHQALIPVVAVADMLLVCNQARKVEPVDYQLQFLIEEMDKDLLAEKLGNCLGEDEVNSDVALNFGLFGCFQAQLAHLPLAEREQKMQLVKQAIASLSLQEREKSFSQCVTEQSIQYLK